MALIKLGGLAQDVRGSLNGSTFSRNNGGAYVRQKVSPVQPISPYSDAARAAFKSISQAWATVLTDSQRAAWIAFAATHTFVNVFGDAITLSGIAMFSSTNLRLVQLGFDRIDDPPATYDAAAVSSVSWTPTQTAGALVNAAIAPILERALTADEGLYLWMTPPYGAGRNVQDNQFRLANNRTANLLVLTMGVYNALSAYNVRFNSPTVASGQKIAIAVGVINSVTGALGVSVTAIGTIVDD